jgi:hypothetical protein
MERRSPLDQARPAVRAGITNVAATPEFSDEQVPSQLAIERLTFRVCGDPYGDPCPSNEEARMATADVWIYRQTTWKQTDLSGFSVEAIDGSIGKIDEASNEVSGSFIVVDTGPWIFGKKVMLPAGVIRDVDLDAQTVFVNRTKDQIKSAPEFDESTYRDDTYRDRLGSYYGPGGAGYQDYN